MLVPLQDLAQTSRVWIYQSDQVFTPQKEEQIKEDLYNFLDEWVAHSQVLHTGGEIIANRFLLIMVDESYASTSGCSQDVMHKFIHDLEVKYGVTLLDRMNVAYEDADSGEIKIVHLNDLAGLIKDHVLSEDTYVFNNLVGTKEEFEAAWRTKIKNSWHKRFI